MLRATIHLRKQSQYHRRTCKNISQDQSKCYSEQTYDPKADFAPPPNADCCGDACCASCPNAEDLAANAEKPPLVVPEPPKAEPDDDPLANGDLLALANGDPPKALPVLLPPPKADWLPNEGPLPNAGRPEFTLV